MNTSATPRPSSTRAKRAPVHRQASASVLPSMAYVMAQVVEASSDAVTLRLQGSDSDRRALRAASCLVEPAPGDTVACLCEPHPPSQLSGEVWVVAVLRRSSADQPATLAAPSGLVLSSGDTRLHMGPAGMELRSPQLEVVAERCQVSAGQAQVVLERLHLVAQTIKRVGGLCSSVFDSVQLVSQRYLRSTRGLDRVQAQQIDQQAEQLLQLHAQHTLINGEKLVKARGSQIHFG